MKQDDTNELIEKLTEMLRTKKLVWEEDKVKGLVLRANLVYAHGAITPTGLREEDLLPVQEWCEMAKCGKRISFDMFKFKDRKEITAFLLVWG
jgi:hypothetical protein